MRRRRVSEEEGVSGPSPTITELVKQHLLHPLVCNKVKGGGWVGTDDNVVRLRDKVLDLTIAALLSFGK